MTHVAVLNLPKGSVFCLDGQAVALQRDDFVGITSVPNEGFHLLTVRAGANTPGSPLTNSSVTSAFVLPEGQIFCREYNPKTEEVSPNQVDSATERNLHSHIDDSQLRVQKRTVPFHHFISKEQFENWNKMTNYISNDILRLRGINQGCKLVAGMFDESSTTVDGQPIDYPLIPLLGEKKGTKHEATKRYLSDLTPKERTALHLAADPGDEAFSRVLTSLYGGHWRYLLGDVQLAFVSFQHIHCFASLEHWRDLLTMLSYVSESSILLNTALFSGLLKVINTQMATVDMDFLQTTELSEGNFLVPAIHRLVAKTYNNSSLAGDLAPLLGLLRDRFDLDLNTITETLPEDETDSDDDDSPVVMTEIEIESFENRRQSLKTTTHVQIDPTTKAQFPLLTAAMLPNEDVLMTCARALADARDVSLVREAAAYLEEVEAGQSSVVEALPLH